MVSDIQHALKRIPPEISTLLHNPHAEYQSVSFAISISNDQNMFVGDFS